jgi:hypothetical protein
MQGEASSTDSVWVHGLVGEPRRITAPELAALPQTERTVTFVSRDGDRTVTYRGPLLTDVIAACGGLTEAKRHDRLRACLVARSATGYEVVFSWGEIDPLYGDRKLIVALHAAGEPLEGIARLVVPDDHHGARYVGQLVEIDLRPFPTG